MEQRNRRLTAVLTLMAAPMLALYALGIGIAWMVAPRRKDDD